MTIEEIKQAILWLKKEIINLTNSKCKCCQNPIFRNLDITIGENEIGDINDVMPQDDICIETKGVIFANDSIIHCYYKSTYDPLDPYKSGWVVYRVIRNLNITIG